MVNLMEIRFLLLVSLMIFPAYALDVIISGAHHDFKQKSTINAYCSNGVKVYDGTLSPLTYAPQLGIFKVIVYITGRSRCIEMIRPAVRAARLHIADELKQWNCELVFLGIENFDDDEYHLISAFMLDKIRARPFQRIFTIETIGENHFDQYYGCYGVNFNRYQESAQICGGILSARLRSIRHGAIAPVECNDKEIKLLGYEPTMREVSWYVFMVNNTYCPKVNVSEPEYNFLIKNPNKNICLLIVSGNEYSAITHRGMRSLQRVAMKTFLTGMQSNDEVLVIIGAFNFDWTEVYIVAQIILKHSEGCQSSDYRVFTCGYGMFNTYYLNVNFENDRRFILQQPNSNVSEVINGLMGGEVKKRQINLAYYYYEWLGLEMSINLCNGQYVPEMKYINFTVPHLNQKIAFIVYDHNEQNYQIDYAVVVLCVQALEQSDICVVFIEAINIGLHDIHIIAEWIDRHSGVTHSEQIAVLGGGIFDTIFQSQRTTYNQFHNTKRNVMIEIRNAYVNNGNEKFVFAANIDDGNFEVWSFPMNTVVNGFYEPDLMPDKNMFDTADRRRVYFIVISAESFRKIATTYDVASLTSSFRRTINPYYPPLKWRVFLVGLVNFEERDSHLFAELIRRQTIGKSLQASVRITSYGISQSSYRYKDTVPFDFDTTSSPIHERFTTFFRRYIPTMVIDDDAY